MLSKSLGGVFALGAAVIGGLVGATLGITLTVMTGRPVVSLVLFAAATGGLMFGVLLAGALLVLATDLK
jgi:hypothetical protein